MDSLPSLDTVGRALDISQSNVPYPLWEVDGGWRGEEGEWEEGRKWDRHVKWVKIVFKNKLIKKETFNQNFLDSKV